MQQVVISGESPDNGIQRIKTDNEGNLVIQLEGATVNIGDVDIASPLGDQAKAASVSVAPATDIPATRMLGKVAIDQVTANANEVVVKTSALPSGAATEQGLDDILAKLSADPATQTTLASALTALQIIDNFISGNRGMVTEDNSAAILAALPTSLGKKAATASISVVQADPTRTPVAHAKDMTGSAVTLSAVSVICQDLWLLQVGSTGQAYWGDSSVQAGHGMPLSTTEPFHIQGPIDLANIYCIGNAADDVAYCYTYEV